MSYKTHKYSVVTPLVKEFLTQYPDAEFGFAHTVLSDDNYDNHCIESCLNRAANTGVPDDDPAVLFLRSLLEIPEDVREKEPDIIPELLTDVKKKLLDELWRSPSLQIQVTKQIAGLMAELEYDGFLASVLVTVDQKYKVSEGHLKLFWYKEEAVFSWTEAGREYMNERHAVENRVE